jgi:hypothetical protein
MAIVVLFRLVGRLGTVGASHIAAAADGNGGGEALATPALWVSLRPEIRPR